MTRICYDSDTPAGIPSDAEVVACYSEEHLSLFPNAVQVLININPNLNRGHVLDIEPLNWPAVYAVDWALMRRAAGIEPTVYCPELWSTWSAGYSWPDVLNAFAARGVPPPLIWTANWSRPPGIKPGTIAHQYANSVMLGFHADASVCADYWPGVEPVPAPPQQPVDPASALNRIKAGRALLLEADIEFQNAQEDLTP